MSSRPMLGRNTWGGWGPQVTEANVRAAAKAMVDSGLIQHGWQWQYVNIDDGWQGRRGGPYNALQPNEKFGDRRAMCDYIHGLGLKAGTLVVKELEDGSRAVGLFNPGTVSSRVTARWERLGPRGPCAVRDLWRHKDLGAYEAAFPAEVPPDGVVLVRLMPIAPVTSGGPR